MGDARTDFGEFYAGGGAAQPVEADVVVSAALTAIDLRIDALKGRMDAAAAVAALEPDGPEALADVKEKVNEVVTALGE